MASTIVKKPKYTLKDVKALAHQILTSRAKQSPHPPHLHIPQIAPLSMCSNPSSLSTPSSLPSSLTSLLLPALLILIPPTLSLFMPLGFVQFVLSLENDLTVRAKTTEVDIEDFCSGSYRTIFGQEMRRRVKQVPLAFYKASFSSLFSGSDFAGWTFKYEGEKDGENGLLNIHEGNEVSRTKRQRVEC